MSTDVQTVNVGLDKQSRRRSKDTEKTHRRSSNFQNKKHKYDHKFRKKTSANNKCFPPYKKRNKDCIIPPTKFLLGGNINDPLNLNSLQDEDINRAMNAVTPKSSPLPTPKHRKGEIEVIIPPDITDPLNLIAGDDDATYEAMLTSPIKKTQKKQKKKNKRKSHRSSSGHGSGKEDSIEGAKLDHPDPSLTNEKKTEDEAESKNDSKIGDEAKDSKEAHHGPPAKRHKSENNNRASLRKIELKERKADLDKIVSPVIPQPGAWNDRHRFRPPPQRTPQIDKSQVKQMPKFKEGNAKFRYGNYPRYYGYRNPSHGTDVRLKVLEKHKILFEGKDVLDIGCNSGHLTLAIARDFHPNRVVGMDIDRSLIQAARSNIRHYVNCGKKDKFYPVSMPIIYGPVDVPGVNEDNAFPHNISFVQGNYVLESDVLLAMEQPQFDVILCLSITKWLQLNWGDAGLKRAFKRMFAQLRPGGVLILEAQSFESYKKKKNMTLDTWNNYDNMELYPHRFSQYLLSEVGFSKCEMIGAPVHHSKGFQRPIRMFTKEDPSFDTPRPASRLGHNTDRFESYSFRLPDSVHCPDEFSGDSNFPYETPKSFNSSESGFSESFMLPRRYHIMRYPIEEVGGAEEAETSEVQGDVSTSEEWRPTCVEENTALSMDSTSEDHTVEDNANSQDSQQMNPSDIIKGSEICEHSKSADPARKARICIYNEISEEACDVVQRCPELSGEPNAYNTNTDGKTNEATFVTGEEVGEVADPNINDSKMDVNSDEEFKTTFVKVEKEKSDLPENTDEEFKTTSVEVEKVESDLPDNADEEIKTTSVKVEKEESDLPENGDEEFKTTSVKVEKDVSYLPEVKLEPFL